MNELYFSFEGKDYKAKLTVKKYYSQDYYHVVLVNHELINRFSISYIFGYSKFIGFQDVSRVERPNNKPIVEALCAALGRSFEIEDDDSTNMNEEAD